MAVSSQKPNSSKPLIFLMRNKWNIFCIIQWNCCILNMEIREKRLESNNMFQKIKAIMLLSMGLSLTAMSGYSLSAVLHDNAGTLRNNLSTYYNTNSFGGGWSIADQFGISSNSNVTSIDFSYTNEVAIGFADFAIYDNSFSLISGVTRTALGNIDTGLNSYQIPIHNIYTATIDNLLINLGVGTYWFAYQLIEVDGGAGARVAGGAPTSDTIGGSGFLQNVNDFSSWHTAYTRTDHYYDTALDFTIYGESVEMPAPAPLALMGLGLAAIGFARKKKAA